MIAALTRSPSMEEIRDLLLKGLGWIVGNGKSINVWQDPWLSPSKPSLPIGPPTEQNQHLKVADLLSPISNAWDLPAIRQHLPHLEDSICLLRPISLKTEDSLVWLPAKSGIFSTKTAYGINKKHSSPLLFDDFNWHTNVWQVKASPKVKKFLWKAAVGSFPAGEQLATRGLLSAFNCKRCGAVESTLHILFLCPFAQKVWEFAPLTRMTPRQPVSSVKSLLSNLKASVNLPPTGLLSFPLYPWILWKLWIARYQFQFEDRVISEEETTLAAISEAKAWQHAQWAMEKPKTPLAPRNMEPSPAGNLPTVSLMMELDAAWNERNHLCGMGWIGRDSQGLICFKGSASSTHVISALSGEALAVRAALREASTRRFTSVCIRSDSKVLVDLLRSSAVVNELVGLLGFE
ncbi:unnamed protein product [Arabidopsis halleri]